jgi:Arc/MetJ-type ribon-helix-helix transcriptional regulator
MIYRNRRIYDFKMRINKSEKDMIQTLTEEGKYKSASDMVRSLIKERFDESRQ